jgi:hypothetical protein
MEADRWQRLDEEIAALQAAVTDLQGQLLELIQRQGVLLHPVEQCLRQRGLSVLAHGDRTRVLLPVGSSLPQTGRFYELLRRYSFRLFLRDLVQYPAGPGADALSRYCSLATARTYLKELHNLGIVVLAADGSYRLVPQQVRSFGPTLEWYVSQILQREFLAPTMFAVRLRKTHYGGDYDVISLLEQQLLYVEVKSSPPRGVEAPAIDAFLDRLDDLQPDLAVFLVDTELRMRDKIVELFQEAFQQRYGQESAERWPVERLVAELFHIGHAVYLVNSRKGIYSNLRLCFRDYRRCDRQVTLPWNGPDKRVRPGDEAPAAPTPEGDR